MLALLVLFAPHAAARNWQLGIDSVGCDAAGAMTLATRIRYLGPKAPVESPVVRLVDAAGKPRTPRGLVWKSGSKNLAALLVAGGVRGLESGEAAEIQLRFDAREAAGPAQGDEDLDRADRRSVMLSP